VGCTVKMTVDIACLDASDGRVSPAEVEVRRGCSFSAESELLREERPKFFGEGGEGRGGRAEGEGVKRREAVDVERVADEYVWRRERLRWTR
jgi:hypothetical protein